MLTVPVLWISRHPDILARGYADEGFLEAMLARSTWRPPHPVTFEHHEVRGRRFPHVEGALVVLPARHHASAEDVAWLRRELRTLQWSVVVLAGDEEWIFPWRSIPESPRQRVWTMQPEQGHERLSGRIPGGWYPGTDTALAAQIERAHERPLDWMFAGQVTHERRQQCVAMLRRLNADRPGRGLLHETDGYLRGMPQSEYWSLLAGAKVVPCPSGPCTVDTARALEALEAGAVPVVDAIRPRGDQFDYWSLCFGDDHPLITIEDWSTFPQVMDAILADWTRISNQTFAWWQAWKRRITTQMDTDLRDVARAPRVARDLADRGTPDDRITVLVTTSPIPAHPQTGVIHETIASIREQLPHAQILIGVDGIRPEQAHQRGDYDEYVRRLLWFANNNWHNVLPVLMPEWLHQAGTTRRLLDLVDTDHVLFVEHDTPVCGQIDWSGICDVIDRGWANAIRLHIESDIIPEWQHLMLDRETRWIAIDDAHDHVPLRRTVQWWQRPHVASTAFYRDQVMPIFGESSRTMIEDVMYGIVWHAHQDEGEAGWDRWKVWVYTPEGDMRRSRHLDGRNGDPKFDMTFAYAGVPPRGAPGVAPEDQAALP